MLRNIESVLMVTEPVTQMYSVKKIFLEISKEIHRKTPVPESLF